MEQEEGMGHKPRHVALGIPIKPWVEDYHSREPSHNMSMLYFLASHFIGQSLGSLSKPSLSDLCSSVLPVAFLGSVIWLLAHNYDTVSTWLFDQFTVTATFESSNQAYGKLYPPTSHAPELMGIDFDRLDADVGI